MKSFNNIDRHKCKTLLDKEEAHTHTNTYLCSCVCVLGYKTYVGRRDAKYTLELYIIKITVGLDPYYTNTNNKKKVKNRCHVVLHHLLITSVCVCARVC